MPASEDVSPAVQAPPSEYEIEEGDAKQEAEHHEEEEENEAEPAEE